MFQWYYKVVNEYISIDFFVKLIIQKQEKLHCVTYKIKFFFSWQEIVFSQMTYRINNLSKVDIIFKNTYASIRFK
jgi:hypothetical protein